MHSTPSDKLNRLILRSAVVMWIASFAIAPYVQQRAETLDWSKIGLPPDRTIHAEEFAGYSVLMFAPNPDRGFNSVVLSETPYTIQLVAGIALMIAAHVWVQTRRDRAAQAGG